MHHRASTAPARTDDGDETYAKKTISFSQGQSFTPDLFLRAPGPESGPGGREPRKTGTANADEKSTPTSFGTRSWRAPAPGSGPGCCAHPDLAPKRACGCPPPEPPSSSSPVVVCAQISDVLNKITPEVFSVVFCLRGPSTDPGTVKHRFRTTSRPQGNGRDFGGPLGTPY